MPRLFRGLAVGFDDLDRVADSIRQNGLQPVEERRWRNDMPAPQLVRQRQKELQESPARIRDVLRSLPSAPLVYACGDEFGACNYALSHNRSNEHPASLLVEFEVPVDALCVDGKDFLYTAFQLWDRSGANHRDKVRGLLVTLFGQGVLKYFDWATTLKETIERVGVCDLACHDLNVITSHLNNSTLIRGRCRTEFCSSFQLQLPVPASAICRIENERVMPERPSCSVTVEDLFG